MTVDILLGHASLQIQDTPAQMAADVAKVFARAVKKEYRWLTGTEANSSAAAKIIRDEAEANGFWFVRGSDMWLAVPKDLCPGLPEFEFIQVLDGVKGRFTDKGVLRASWVDPQLGRITVLVSHQLTLGQAEDFPAINPRIAQLVGDLGRKYGKGAAKVFYAGDQNEDDRRFDTFDGQPFTTAADKLGKHEGSLGSRETEVIASFDPDGLVEATSWDVLNDRDFFMFSDHFFVEAGYRILDEAPTPAPEVPVSQKRLTNLADVLRAGGLKVVEVDGWKTRSRPASTGGFNPVGVLCHHTATGKSTSDQAVIRLLVNGRSDLPGPLCNLGLGRDGTVYVISAGRANHAGKAKASGTVGAGDGNALYVGIEAFNDGVGEAWPKVQYDAYVKTCAVLSQKVTGNSAATVRGHKETSVTGKVDPRFDMVKFRAAVAAHIAAPAVKPAPKSTTPNITKATDPKSTLGQMVAALKKVVSNSSDKDAKDDANQALEQIRVHVKAKHKLRAALAALKKHERKS